MPAKVAMAGFVPAMALQRQPALDGLESVKKNHQVARLAGNGGRRAHPFGNDPASQ
jgi:hypothetical protein